MRSPFPGMDPYLEDPAFWPDFHHEFISAWRSAVRRGLPPNYEARLDVQIRLVDVSAETSRLVRPDVTVVQGGPLRPETRTAETGTTISPVTLPLPIAEEEIREAWIEILHLPEQTVVAVLELLSPRNKTGDGRPEYLAKRRAVLRQGIHLVELDLLVGGERIAPPYELPRGDYFALVARGDRQGECQVYPWTVRDRLPTIRIPLKSNDPEAVVHLQDAFEMAFERGGYDAQIDYTKPLSAPLSETDARWAAEFARSFRGNGHSA
ncbi:MAG TPA: DUF4058 family protein [Pirellulales bacterium]|nr:DUF4058 family protein [Pirellulales bacterium]